MYDFKRSTESVGLGILPSKTKILSNQTKVKKNEVTIANIKNEVLQTSDSARYLGQKITFEEQETVEVKNRLKAAWAAFHKYRQELTSKAYRLCHRLRLFTMVIAPTTTYASGTWTLSQTRKNDQDRTTKDASPHRPDEKKIQNEREKGNKREDHERNGKTKENDSLCDTDEETGEGSEQNSNKDQDSDVSFQDDEDEDIDKCDMKKTKIPCWIETHRRLKLRIAMRNCIPPGRTMDKQNYRLEPWS